MSRDSLFLNISRISAVTTSRRRTFHIRLSLLMISSSDVYKIVGDSKLHRQTGLGSSFMQSIPTDLLEHSSDATGAAEVVAGVSSIPALHHLQLV